MSQQIQITGGAKVRALEGVITGTSGVLDALPINGSLGIPQLDVNGKILVSQLPNSVMEYQGTWNVTTNTPYLVDGVGNQGDVYIVTNAASTGTAHDFGSGSITFFNGDQAIYSGTIWQRASGATGTVTSVGLSTDGNAITIGSSPITTSGTITANFAGTNLQYINGAGNLTTFPTLLSSVGLSMPSAFSVANSPLTANGTIAVTGAGYPSQYIRGDGTLADFPTSGGGGSSVSYYLNGGTSQGTIGGVTYYEMSKTADTGTGVDFPKSGDGLIVSFLTDAGDPAQLNIPAGNWNYEIYASMSSNGGTPQMYAELYVYNGTTFTLISTSSNEILYDGVNLNLYTFAMTVPATTLALTDRLAIKLYSTNSGGKTTTVHTQDSHLCQVITTFSTGITALNGLTAQVQYFATGTSGTDFNISSSTATHTFNIPDASATARGLITTGTQTIAGSKTFTDIVNSDSGILLKNGVIPNATSSYVGLGSNGAGITITTKPSATVYNNNFYFPASSNTYTFPSATGTIALTSNLSSYVPTSRQLTINGTAYDLSADRTWSVGTVTSVAALTLGTTGTDLSSTVATGTTTPVITLNVPTASATNRGALSSTDWSTFNSKEPAITAGTTSQYWRGDKTWQTLNTTAVTEGTNLYFTNARSIASTLTGYTSGAGTITSADSILGAIQKLNGNIGALVTGVSSVFGRTGAVVATEGDYSLTQLSDVTITSASSGQVLRYNGTSWVNATETYVGTVTSVAMTVPTGLSIAGSPITSSGTLAVTFASGYSIPTNASQTNWDTAYSWGNPSGVYLPLTGGTLSGSLQVGSPSATATASLAVTKTITGSVNSRGILSDGVIQSGVTDSAYYFQSKAYTAAGSYTIALLTHYMAEKNQILNTQVTTQVGFYANNTLGTNTAGTNYALNNYGFYGNLSISNAYSENYNLYMNGSAYNYLYGLTGIGAVPSGVYNLEVTGISKFTSNVGIGSLNTSWQSTAYALQLGTTVALSSYGLSKNLYYDGTNYRALTTGYGSLIQSTSGGFSFYSTTTSVTAAAVATLTSSLLTITNTGAATFSSSIAATSATFSGNVIIGGSSPVYLKFNVQETSANRVAILYRGLQGYDASMVTTFGTPYLSIGGQENLVNSIQTIGFGFTNGTSYIQPAEIGFQTTSLSAYTKGDLVFATREVTTNTAPTERMRITSGGNVGIGTSSPNRLLDLASTTQDYQLRLSYVSTIYYDIGRNSTDGLLKFYGSQTGYTGYVFGGVDGERMRITSTGDMYLTGRSTNTDYALYFLSNDTTSNIYSSNSGAISKPLLFYTAGTTRLTIAATGNIGIGTTSPQYLLHLYSTNSANSRIWVQGTTNYVITQFSNSSAGAFYHGIDDSTGGGFTGTAYSRFLYSSGDYPFIIAVNGTERLRITGTGNVGLTRVPVTNTLEVNGDASKTTAGLWAANSDINIKTDINTIEGALDRINKVRLVKFKYKDAYKENNQGIKDIYYHNVIAQEFKEVYADYVYNSGDLFEEKEVLQVDTTPMYIDSVSAIQELSKMVIDLQNQINELKNK